MADVEQWKDVPGYEGLYQVSTLGRVKSRRKILRQESLTGGYMNVWLCKNGKRNIHRVHRLVATAFIPNEYNKAQVNHKNMLRNDNRVDNLEWCTASENQKHAFANGRSKAYLKKMHDANKKKVGIYRSGSLVVLYNSVKECAKALNVDEDAILRKVLNPYTKNKGNMKPYIDCVFKYET